MYHSVSAEATRDWGPWQYTLSPAAFDRQIDWLTTNRTVVPLADIVAYLRGETAIPDNAVALTFDDGYEDFRSKALPVLQTYDAPCTLYISTALMTARAAPYEFRLARTLTESEEVTVRTDGSTRTYRLATDEDTIAAYRDLREVIETRPVEQRHQFLTDNGFSACPTHRILSPDDVRTLRDESLVTIGSHGHHHRRAESLSWAAVDDDVRQSLSVLGDILKNPPKHFSFPYGSHSRTARQVLRDLGFHSAVTTESRAVRPRDWHRCHSIPRIDMASNDGGLPDTFDNRQ